MRWVLIISSIISQIVGKFIYICQFTHDYEFMSLYIYIEHAEVLLYVGT